MENNRNKYNFITQVLILFAFDVLFLLMVAAIAGNKAKEVSTMFQLGSKGLALSTLLQFLLNAIIAISLKTIFFSDKLIKNMMALWRSVFLLASVLASTILFIIIFHWFQISNLFAWISFIICFAGCFTLCSLYMIIKNKLDNRKYNKLLSSYKDQHERSNDNELH